MGSSANQAPRGMLFLLAALMLSPALAGAQHRPRRAPIRFPQDNIPDRAPLPGTEDGDEKPADGPKADKKKDKGPGLWETVKGTAAETVGVVRDWHGQLAKHMPPAAAWAVLGIPAYLLLLLIFLVRRRRRRPPPVRPHLSRTTAPAPRPRAKTAAKPAAAEQPEPRKPKTAEEIPPLEPSPAEQVLLANDGAASLHEAFVLVGADQTAVRALRLALGAAIDEVTWAAAVNSKNASLIRPVRDRWIKALAAERVKAWLHADPLVSKTGLAVGMPDLHEVSELGSVMLTLPDGLGADLNEAQEDLLQRARWVLQQVWQEPTPHALLAVARRAEAEALLDEKEIKAYPLALLLHGVEAIKRGAAAEIDAVELGQEFHDALQEHRQLVDTPIGGEGCAVHTLHAIGGGTWPGIGTVAASMAGAAFSAMAVTVKISKLIGELDDGQRDACGRLGALVAAALEDRKSGNGAAVTANIRKVLGQTVAEAALKRADDLVATTKRLGKQPVWPDAPSSETPDLVLANLHRTLVQHALKQCNAAERRLDQILSKLAYEGKTGENRTLAMQRLGYAVACFGMSLLRSTDTDLLSAGRETISTLTGG